MRPIQALPETGVRLAYGDRGLFVAVRVKDEYVINHHRGKDIWNGDSFELFLETTLEPGRNDRAYDSDTYHFLFAPTSADNRPAAALVDHPAFAGNDIPKDILWEAGIDENGWRLEILFPPESLFGWRPTAGEIIGFSFMLGDSDGGDRENLYPWQNSVNMNWHRLQFGRARFVVGETRRQ